MAYDKIRFNQEEIQNLKNLELTNLIYNTWILEKELDKLKTIIKNKQNELQ